MLYRAAGRPPLGYYAAGPPAVRTLRRKPGLRRIVETQAAHPPDVAAIESRLDSALGRSNIRVTAAQRRALAEYVALLAQ